MSLRTAPRRACATARAVLAAALAAAALPAAQAGPSGAEMRSVFGFRIALACVRMDAAYEHTWIGDLQAGQAPPGATADELRAFWAKVHAMPASRCLRERGWIPRDACRQLTALRKSAMQERRSSVAALNDALDRLPREVQVRIDDALYVEDDARSQGDAFTCPAQLPARSELHPRAPTPTPTPTLTPIPAPASAASNAARPSEPATP